MAGIPDDIMEKARTIHEANSATDWMAKAGQILTPVERIAYAILAERTRGEDIAARLRHELECEQMGALERAELE